MLLPRGCEFSDIISRKGKKQSISECPKIIHFIIREPGGGGEGLRTTQQSILESMQAGKQKSTRAVLSFMVGAGSRWLF